MQSNCKWLLLGLLLVAPRVQAAPSEVIFPQQQLPLTFSHARHLAKKIACDFCHEKAPGSHRSSDNLLPTEEVCSTCHPIEREHPERDDKNAMGCLRCHPGFVAGVAVARAVIPTPNLKFDHAVHVDKGVPCLRCHDKVDKLELATRAQLPSMPLCLGCHDSRKGGLHGPSRCATCHLMKPDNTLEQQLPSGTLMPSGVLRGDAHTLDFRTHHNVVAANDEKYCANCHRQDFCLNCHNGVIKPLDFHGNDYVSKHAIEARKNEPRCDSCHRLQSFCLGCHERLGIVDRATGSSAFGPGSGRQFHPSGWADPVAGPNHHKWQAERNIKQCASCHRQETCLECHATNGSAAGSAGKMWVNPHPPDWRGSTRCQSLADRNVRVCLRCHAPTDSQLSCR
jgi:hypothetical protein